MADLQKSKTGSDAIRLTASKIMVMAIGMVSSMLLSRFRTLTEYGTYSQLLMAINLVSSLLMLGLFSGKGRNPGRAQQVFVGILHAQQHSKHSGGIGAGAGHTFVRGIFQK